MEEPNIANTNQRYPFKMPRKIQKLPPFEKIKYRIKHHIRFINDDDYTQIAGLVGISYSGHNKGTILKFQIPITSFEESYRSKWPHAFDNEVIYMLLEYIITVLSRQVYLSKSYAKYKYPNLCIYRIKKSLVKKWKSKLF